MLQPALLGGVVIGVLSALPVVNVVNLCCCAWILLGGGLAAYQLQQTRPAPISAGDGLLVGLIAGAIGAGVYVVVSLPINLVMGPFQARMVESALENARDIPPELRAWLEGMRGESPMLVGIGFIVSAFFMLVVSSLFGMLGGLFGALLFKKDGPPPPPPPPPGTGYVPPPPVAPPPVTPPPVPPAGPNDPT